MKRPLLLVLVVLALVGGVVWMSRSLPRAPDSDVPAFGKVEPPASHSAADPTAAVKDDPAHAPSEREAVNSVPATVPEPAFAARTDAHGTGVSRFFGRVTTGSEQEPVSTGTITLHYYRHKVDPRVLARTQQATPDRGNVKVADASLYIDPEGRFDFILPPYVSLATVDILPARDQLLGRADAGGTPRIKNRFAPTHLDLGQRLFEEELNQRLVVKEGMEVEGAVRDADSNAPVAGAHILFGPDTNSLSTAESEADGTFVLGGQDRDILCSSRETLHVRASHHEYQEVDLELPFPRDARHPPRVEVRLRRGFAISGSVLDERGSPVQALVLELEAHGTARRDATRTTTLETATTDAAGVFQFSAISACDSAEIHLAPMGNVAPALGSLRHPLGRIESDRRGIEIHLARSVFVRVGVTSVEGVRANSGAFQVLLDQAGAALTSALRQDASWRTLRIPLGTTVRLLAYANAGDSKVEETYWSGVQELRFDQIPVETPEIVIAVSSRGDWAPPPLLGGGQVFEFPSSNFLRATVDAQILDARSRQPLALGTPVRFSADGASLQTAKLVDGWIRIRGVPGERSIEIQIGDRPTKNFTVMLPMSGYAKTEFLVPELEAAPR